MITMDSFEPVNIDLLFIKSEMNPAAQKLGGLSYHVAATEAGVHEQCQLVLTWKLQLRAPSKSNYSIHLPHASQLQGSFGSYPDLNCAAQAHLFQMTVLKL